MLAGAEDHLAIFSFPGMSQTIVKRRLGTVSPSASEHRTKSCQIDPLLLICKGIHQKHFPVFARVQIQAPHVFTQRWFPQEFFLQVLVLCRGVLVRQMQDGSGTGNRNRRNRFARNRKRNRNHGNRFSGYETGPGTVHFCQNRTQTQKPLSREESSEPKTGTARTVPYLEVAKRTK